jgi:AcrR family transcriptional regulator
MTRKRKTQAQNRQIIRDVTLKLLEEKNYLDVSINKIAKESGINISQIYRYYPNGKPDILVEMGSETVRRGAPDPDLPQYSDPKKLLEDLIRFYLDTHKRNLTVLKSLHTVFLSNPDLYTRDLEAISQGDSDYSLMRTTVERFGPGNRENDAKLIFHLVDAVIHRHVLEVPITKSDEDLVYFLKELIIRYLMR